MGNSRCDNAGQWVELVVAHWRLGRQMSDGFFEKNTTRDRIPMTTRGTTNEVPSPLTRL
jgi:hypothetical protein